MFLYGLLHQVSRDNVLASSEGELEPLSMYMHRQSCLRRVLDHADRVKYMHSHVPHTSDGLIFRKKHAFQVDGHCRTSTTGCSVNCM
jgi:hypothetical protein